MGLYQRHASRFWWMTYTMNEQRYFESTKTTSKELAKKIWKRREGEIAMGLFKVGGRVNECGSDNCAKSSNVHTLPGFRKTPSGATVRP